MTPAHFLHVSAEELANDTYEYMVENNEVTITKYIGTKTAVSIPAQIDGLPVTKIGGQAFSYAHLTEVIFPQSIKEIDYWAFRGNALKTVNLPKNLEKIGSTAFAYNALTAISIPKSVSTIGNGAFTENKLTTVNFLGTIETISEEAFAHNALTHIKLPKTVKSIGPKAFEYNKLTSIEIPEGIKEIADSTFFYNPKLEDVTLPNSLEKIGQKAFWSNNLKTIKLPKKLNYIGKEAFQSNQIMELAIPESVDTIEARAFRMNQLTKVDLPKKLTTLGAGAFNKNQIKNISIPPTLSVLNSGVFQDNNLTELSIPSTIEKISSFAFESNQIKKLTIPKMVKTLGSNAFNSNQLKSITIPETVEVLGDSVFSYNQLTSVKMPENMTKISRSLFENNELKNVTIPENVKTIEANAFAGNQLTTISLPKNVETIGYESFSYNKLTTIHFPSSLMKIDYGAFRNNQLTEVTLPSSVTNLEGAVFYDNPLKKVVLPSTDIKLGYNIFGSEVRTELKNEQGFVRSFNGMYTDATFTNKWDEKATGLTLYAKWLHNAQIKGIHYERVVIGKTFDPLKGVTAIDEIDGDITSKITIENEVDTSTVGDYKVFYKVTNSEGRETFEERNISVSENTLPVINGVKDATFLLGEPFKVREGITATDAEDGDITNYLQISSWGFYSPKEVGVYELVYEITDSDGNRAEASRIVSVRPLPVTKVEESYRASNEMAFHWTEQNGVRDYKIYIYDKKGKLLKTVKGPNDTFIQGLKAGENYQVRVRAFKKENGKTVIGDYSKPLSFITSPANVSIKSIQATSKTNAMIKWKKVSTASYYQIQYATNSQFKNSKIKKASNQMTEIKLAALQKGKKYYIRMEAVQKFAGKNYYSDWSAAKSVMLPKR